jgi:hypothetical protein
MIGGGGSSVIGIGGGTTPLGPNVITGGMIVPRNIKGRELFTSGVANRLLGVTTANSDPQYLQAVNDMIANRAINGRTLFSSTVANRILGVTAVGSDPQWMQININMMGVNSVGEPHIVTGAVSKDKIANGSITQEKLTNTIINTAHLIDRSVTNQKLADNAVTNEKILNNSIKSEKFASNPILPLFPTIRAHTDYERRSLRNTIISNNIPTSAVNGDIWMRFY